MLASDAREDRPARRIGRRTVLGLTAAVLLAAATPSAATAGTISEAFDTAPPPGWSTVNNSSPVGVTSWFQGTSVAGGGPFDAYAGAANAYLGVNYNSTAGNSGTISNWAITPLQQGLTTGDAWSFYTRAPAVGTVYPDRLEVRMSTNGACSPGSGAQSVGDFTTVLTTVNPNLTTSGYPRSWTKVSGTLPPMAPASGCIAFRYFVTQAGPGGVNSDYIGLDSFELTDQEDTTVPDTAILSGPTGGQATAGAAFTYEGDPAPGIERFECRLVGPAPDADPAFADCSGDGTSFTDLADGDYRFEVRAVAYSGNADPSPATHEFSVDTTPPDTEIVSGPSGPVPSADAAFTYQGVPAGDAERFECRLVGPAPDADPAFASCSDEGRSFTGLDDGTYRFEVRAVDALGNADPTPATQGFTIDTAPPDTEIVDGPSGVVSSADATLTYRSVPADDVDRFECRLIGPGEDADPAFADCPENGMSFVALDDGTYRFEVRAVDAAGNLDPTPATQGFTVDATPPVRDPDPSTPVGPGPTVVPSVRASAPGPELSAIVLGRRRFVAARQGPTLTVPGRSKETGNRGSRLRLVVSKAATLSFRIEQVTAGRRAADGRCTVGGTGTGARCVRYVAMPGVVPRYAAAGANEATFRGRLLGRTLPAGRYRLTAYATDADGQRSPTRRVGFWIVAR